MKIDTLYKSDKFRITLLGWPTPDFMYRICQPLVLILLMR